MGLKSSLKVDEIFKGVLLAHAILLLHLFIIAALGVVVLVLGGLARNLLWFFIGAAVVVILSAIYIYRRMKTSGQHAYIEIEKMALLRNHDIEIRVLGGLVAFTLKRTKFMPELAKGSSEDRPRLSDPTSRQTQEMTELANLFEKNILTHDEYIKAKQRLFNSS